MLKTSTVFKAESSPYERKSNFIRTADFRHHSARRKYHQHHLDGWRSAIVRFMGHFLQHTVKLWNDTIGGISNGLEQDGLREKSVLFSERPATHSWRLSGCGCPRMSGSKRAIRKGFLTSFNCTASRSGYLKPIRDKRAPVR
ncbi:hypothetical protein EVAR_88650_1 [Eumeta japonica]|uniref:Uncharacterized protein n=1 Tax=Eumeta variegata TaxID=151549 RepID=A0A4C1Y7A2_EUMVA|nr:hypothetical protein EVAR_88650_1 [Eumeta japonica]